MFTLTNLTTPPWLVDGGKGCLQQDAQDCVRCRGGPGDNNGNGAFDPTRVMQTVQEIAANLNQVCATVLYEY